MFNLRFTNGVAYPRDVEWWNSFNQLCIDMKSLDQLEIEWTDLFDEEKEVMKIVSIGGYQTLNQFMNKDLLIIRDKLRKILEKICLGSPFDKEYLLGHQWCYSEYGILLEKNNITLKNELEFIKALNEFLDYSMKLTSGTPAERSKVRKDMFNKLLTKENMIR